MLSPRMPALTALEVFVTVAGAGSLNAAAAELGVSQQAVSARIASLERQVGVPLVSRTPRGSSLTATGVLVSEWADRLLAAAKEVDSGLAALRSHRQTTLRVAASLTIAEYCLPEWLVDLNADAKRRGRPPVTVDLVVANSTTVARLVQQSEVHLGLVEGPAPPRGVRHRTIGHDRLVVVAAAAHPWGRRRTAVTATELARTPLVSREPGSGTRQALLAALRGTLGPDVQLAEPALALPTTAAVRSAVIAGAGPAVVSELAVADDLAAGRLRCLEVAGLDLRRQFRAVWIGAPQPAVGPARDLVSLARRWDAALQVGGPAVGPSRTQTCSTDTFMPVD